MSKTDTPSSSADAMESSSSRVLRIRARPDLEYQQQLYQTRQYWVVKDPLTLRYYRFEEEEFSLLQSINGEQSIEQIKQKFDFQFAPQKITHQELYQFLGMLYRSSLVISDQPGQGAELIRRAERNRWREKTQTLSNLLAIRFKGIDPDRILGELNRWIGWIFSFPVFLLVLLTGLAAAGLIFTQLDLFLSKLPRFQDFFASSNWIYLALVLALTKVCHELGHGLACKRFGSQCHELGFMLLVFTPCLYVNVSDSWLLPNKWKRIFISAAGMYVELILASIAVFVWWFSHPGILHQLALNVIFVCSISTLLINANPLLRYDGYYILSDLLEIPNLRAKATAVTHRTLGALLLGIQPAHDPFLPPRHRWLFGIYSLSAIAYRWILTFTIFWFVYRVLEPYGFKIIGQGIALMLIYGLLISPLVKLAKYFSIPGRINSVKPIRSMVTAGLVCGLLFIFFAVPLPMSIYCSFYVQPAEVVNVFVEEQGRLEGILVQPNQRVTKGDPLIRLSNYQLEAQLARVQSDLEKAQSDHQNAVDSAAYDSTTSFRLNQAKTALNVAKASYTKRQNDLNRLTVVAPVSGLLIAPPPVDPRQSDSGELGFWSDTPLNPKNIGAYLDRQTLVGQIVPDPTKMEGLLAIDQKDIEFIREQQKVRLLVRQLPGRALSAEIANVSPAKMKWVPKQLSSKFGGDLVVTTDKDGIDIPHSTHYLVRVPFDAPQDSLLIGTTGTARIEVERLTLWQRFWRLMKQTFHFEL
jgi:putative peptide zinc metalloprotease protein